MHLIILYGPPAVGKLTVATKLAELNGYAILHLHQTIDLVTALFPLGSEPYSKLNRKIRLDFIEAAAQYQLPGLIFTYGYGSPTADEFIKDVMKIIRTYNGTIHFVYLTASPEALLERVTGASRKKTGKIQDPAMLKEVLEQKQFKQIPFVESLSIDTTDLEPDNVVQKILSYIGRK